MAKRKSAQASTGHGSGVIQEASLHQRLARARGMKMLKRMRRRRGKKEVKSLMPAPYRAPR